MLLTLAAGVAKVLGEKRAMLLLPPWQRSLVLGSYTLTQREGEEIALPLENCYFNKWGLSNEGIESACKEARELRKRFPESELIISVAYAPVCNDVNGYALDEILNPRLRLRK